MKKIVFGIIVSLSLIFNAAAQSNRIDGIRPDAPELAKTGPYKIGVRTLHLIHKNQIDALHVKDGEALPYYDRPLTVEIWYPASINQSDNEKSSEYNDVYLRDGKTKVTLYGAARRDVPPLKTDGGYPVVIISHGYPGNRYLMSHFAENLASKGYVAVSIDHTDSMYHDAGAFPSTLLNRTLDQNFLLDEMIRFNDIEGHFLENMIDSNKTGLIGYSMGGYGAVITAGGGVTELVANNAEASPNGILKRLMVDNEDYQAQLDGRFKAIVAVAPWGMERGFWDAETLKNIKTPMFFIAGSVDSTSGYETGTKLIFESAVNIDRYLLTFENAGHNAAAPIPAPKQAYGVTYPDGRSAFGHYSDPVWDTLRMNNIAQHFITAYFGKILKADPTMDAYLDVVPYSNDAKGENSWKGFQPNNAKGLRLDHLQKQ